jgi:hypothetical protein
MCGAVRWDLELPIARIFLAGRCLACPNLVTYRAISFLMSTCVCGLRNRIEQGAEREEKSGATLYDGIRLVENGCLAGLGRRRKD